MHRDGGPHATSYPYRAPLAASEGAAHGDCIGVSQPSYHSIEISFHVSLFNPSHVLFSWNETGNLSCSYEMEMKMGVQVVPNGLLVFHQTNCDCIISYEKKKDIWCMTSERKLLTGKKIKISKIRSTEWRRTDKFCLKWSLSPWICGVGDLEHTF